MAPGRRRDAVGLRDVRGGTREVAHPRGRQAQRGEVERQLRKRAGIADELDLPRGDRMRAVIVPDGVAGRRGHPAPAQDILHRDVGERCRCPLQHRSRGGVSVGGQQGEPVEQQVEGTRSTRPRRERPDGAADLQQDAPSRGLPSGDERRAPGCQVGLARELQVERLEPPRGLQQQRRSIAGKTRGEGELTAHQVHPGALELIQRPGLRRGQRARAPPRTRRPGSSPAPRPARARLAAPGRP